MLDTYGAPFDEMRGFTCGGWRSMLSLGSPVPSVTSPDVPEFMGQISGDDFLIYILPSLSAADCVNFLSSAPNIDKNAENIAEAERVLQSTLAPKLLLPPDEVAPPSCASSEHVGVCVMRA
jgi:hypothetical protein